MGCMALILCPLLYPLLQKSSPGPEPSRCSQISSAAVAGCPATARFLQSRMALAWQSHSPACALHSRSSSVRNAHRCQCNSCGPRSRIEVPKPIHPCHRSVTRLPRRPSRHCCCDGHHHHRRRQGPDGTSAVAHLVGHDHRCSHHRRCRCWGCARGVRHPALFASCAGWVRCSDDVGPGEPSPTACSPEVPRSRESVSYANAAFQQRSTTCSSLGTP
mmetsp:Transcript_119440/g.309863  ORF Transcript_119440/g.309863 Transcript_119440/m.309863 type:complete len:217 (-) Transcript_119440:855-1505(-)